MKNLKNFTITLVVMILISSVAEGHVYSNYNWILNPNNGHLYAATLDHCNWADAEAEAVALGGHLATINDATENEWLTNNFGGHYSVVGQGIPSGSLIWIGLELVDGEWCWVSGEPVTYMAPWYSGLPADPPGAHAYLHPSTNPFAGTWWNFPIHDAEPDHYPHGIIEIYEQPCWIELEKLLVSGGAAGDWFGISVSIDSDYAIVGAYADDGSVGNSGSAYIFKRDGDNWVQQVKLTASDGAMDDFFSNGYPGVSVSCDYAIVGARYDDSRTGAAYIFKKSDTAGDPNWYQQGDKLTASDGAADDQFGVSVSVNGGYAFVGAYHHGSRAGSVYIFTPNDVDPNKWDEVAKLTASDGEAGDRFGVSVSISGEYAIVGSMFDDDNGYLSGSAYVFKRSGNSNDPNWYQECKLIASDGSASDHFGRSVSISGDYAIVGAYADDDNGETTGSAYIFKRSDDTSDPNWYEQCKLLASDGEEQDHFGISVSVSGGYAIIGAYNDDDNGGNSGSAYMFKKSDFPGDPNWYEQCKLTASDGATDDNFGCSVSVSGDHAVVGAYWDDNKTGSAYVFENVCANPIGGIMDFIEDSVEAGTLSGSGPGKSAQGRLGALINMIEAGGNLIDAELIEDACWQLQDAYNRTDGNSPPPDFVTGPAAAELASKIEALRTTLGCE